MCPRGTAGCGGPGRGGGRGTAGPGPGGPGARSAAADAGQPGELSLARAGRLLGESFLPGPVAAELGRVLEPAGRAHQPVRLGLAVPAGLAGLPWEALPGPGGGPLVLHPLVRLYRKTEAGAWPGAAGSAADRGGDRRPG